MTDPQAEALLAQIRELEKATRRWKLTAVGLALALLLFLIIGGVTSLVATIGYTTARTRAMRAMVEELRAREQVEAQRQQAERRRQEAEKRFEEPVRGQDKKP